MDAFETIQARKAALLLHSLPPDAARQVLARLSAAESFRLRPLLDEIASMRLPRSVAAEWSNKPMPRDSSQPVAGTLRERVEQLSASQVAERMAKCAPSTIAHVLRAVEWPWKSQLLGLLSESRRFEVQACLCSSSKVLAPAALDVLYERLCLDAASVRTKAWMP